MRCAWWHVGMHTMCVVSRADVAVAGRAPGAPARRGRGPRLRRIVRLLPGPPSEYWPIVPSVRTTRWQGTMSGTGLWPSAVPTARTALGRPISAAIQPYGRTSPWGISSAFCQTSRSKSVWPRRSRSMRTRRSPSSRRAMAVGQPRRNAVRRGYAGRPVRARCGAPRTRRRPLGRHRPRHAQPVPGHDERPDRRVDRGRTGRPGPTSTSTAGGGSAGGRRGQAGQRGLDRRRRVRGHAVISSRSGRFGGFEHRAQQGHPPMDLGLDGALGSTEGGGKSRDRTGRRRGGARRRPR